MSDEGEDPLRPPKRKIGSSDSNDSSPTSTRKKRPRVAGLSEDGSDSCSICLIKFLNQEVGIPQNCEHMFCLDCITEWSKRSNTCPVDRITFDSIVVRACAGGRVLRTEAVKVAERRRRPSLESIDEPTVCEVCHNADRHESMLLCDSCDLGFHMQCLTPPLTQIPEHQWLCPHCSDTTVCEVCHNADRHESMLLCDRCDLGFHMECLTPPLTQIPEHQWLCPHCSDTTVCEVCHNADRHESMLLCDRCDLGFHMECLTPPLTQIPEDEWLCPDCREVWGSSRPIMGSMGSSSRSSMASDSRRE